MNARPGAGKIPAEPETRNRLESKGTCGSQRLLRGSSRNSTDAPLPSHSAAMMLENALNTGCLNSMDGFKWMSLVGPQFLNRKKLESDKMTGARDQLYHTVPVVKNIVGTLMILV